MPGMWWWQRHARHHESVDVVAQRLEAVADELEGATTELRAIVTGLRDVHGVIDPADDEDRGGPW